MAGNVIRLPSQLGNESACPPIVNLNCVGLRELFEYWRVHFVKWIVV